MVRRARLEKKPRDGMDGDRRASGRSATRARSIGRRASTSSALSDVGDADVGTEGRDRRRDGRCGDGDDGGDARKKIVSMSSSSSDDRSVVASSSREADGDDVDDGGGARSIASRSIARSSDGLRRIDGIPVCPGRRKERSCLGAFISHGAKRLFWIMVTHNFEER